MLKAQRNVSQLTCIFCGEGGTPGNPISPEHLWSAWMSNILSRVLPQDKEPEHLEFHQKAIRGLFIEPATPVTIKGRAHNKKQIKAVCQRCNNGWMSIIETAVKPKLSPLILGDPILLDWRARQIIADWIVMKLFVAEFNAIETSPPDPIFSQRDREYFMGWRLIPPHIRIWIAKHSSRLKWKSGIFRDSSGLGPASMGLPPLPRPKTTQSVTFGIGQLLIHITATNVEALYPILNTLGEGPTFRLLWPIGQSDIRWPPLVTVSEIEADWIAQDLDRIVNGPRTIHVE